MKITDVKATKREQNGDHIERTICFNVDGLSVKMKETLPSYAKEIGYEKFDTPTLNIEINNSVYEEWEIIDAFYTWMVSNNL